MKLVKIKTQTHVKAYLTTPPLIVKQKRQDLVRTRDSLFYLGLLSFQK